MGLDMYLFLHTADGDKIEVGYWRKANAIHNWFVENNQGGEDESTEAYRVGRETLSFLKEDVQIVYDKFKQYHPNRDIEDLSDDSPLNLEFREFAEEFLPPVSGFFFGSTDINTWYVADLVETLEIIEKAEKMLEEEENSHLVYMAWW